MIPAPYCQQDTMTPTQVLVIDDDAAHYELIVDMATRVAPENFRFTWCSKADQAITALSSAVYDVYLLDYHLGNYNGLELLQHVFPDGVTVPIILLTGAGSSSIDAAALHMGVADYFDKTELRGPLLIRSIRYAIERKRVEAEQRRLYQQVSELEQLKADMIRVLAHDMMSPLSSVNNYLSLLRRSVPLSEEHQEYLGVAQQSLRQMQQTLTDVLTLEKLDYLQQGSADPVDLRELVAESEALYQPRAASQNQRLAYHLPAQPVIVAGKTGMLREALHNLLDNALKYTPTGGAIAVKMQVEGKAVQVQVQDTGYGIPASQLKLLFQPFSRIQMPATQNIQGTGLGLYLIRRIIERHHGTVSCQSVEGQGSLFSIVLPVLEEG